MTQPQPGEVCAVIACGQPVGVPHAPGCPYRSHEFIEDPADATTCLCGVPVITHDLLYPC